MQRILNLTAILLFAAGALLAATKTHAAEATFTRSLAINGHAELTVETGSGTIHLTRGPAGSIHVFGRVRSSWGGSDQRVREIADHPPVQQTGNIVRIGAGLHNLHNISIDYEVQAPDGVLLNASTGSGNINNDGVGQNAKLETGSGNIHASGLKGSFSVETGSGNIFADQETAGDVKAETGSGNLELHRIRGSLKAETGSGAIKVDGAPTGNWKLETGSGSIEIWTNNANFNLDAESGSGAIHLDRAILTQGSEGKHHISGKVGSGGPLVRLEAGSGSIRVH
jgi:DUF4097 and DUF4098 domain-containing protein YvlB